MLRLSKRLAAGWSPLASGKELITNLWSKPETRDERVKEYVPEVLEESLTEQRKVLAESTSRDAIVECGHRVLREIENKSATPAISPHLQKIMAEFGAKNLIGQRALSQLLYPTATSLAAAGGTSELVTGFVDNFKSFVETIEQNGRQAAPLQAADAYQKLIQETTEQQLQTSDVPAPSGSSGDAASGPIVVTPMDKVESPDATYFVKLAAGMALSNIAVEDYLSALRCCDAALQYAIDDTRRGGLYGMKAGILIRQKKYELAADAARLSIEASDNVQGYIQGAAALKALKRSEEVIALLEQAREAHPKNDTIATTLLEARKVLRLSLPADTAALPAPTSDPLKLGENRK